MKKNFQFDANGKDVDYGAFGSDDDDDASEEDEDQSDAEDQDDEENEAGGSQKILRQDLRSEVSKGLAIKQQLTNWDSLFESRIQIQKVLTKINQYPQHDAW